MKTARRNTMNKYFDLLNLDPNLYGGGGANMYAGGGGFNIEPATIYDQNVGTELTAPDLVSSGVDVASDVVEGISDGASSGSKVGSGVTQALTVANSLIPRQGLDHNPEGVAWQNYDFGADMTSDRAEKWDKTLDATDMALDGISAAGSFVPGYGWLISGIAQGLKLGSKFLPSFFGNSDAELTQDYMGKRMTGAEAGTAAKVAAASQEATNHAYGGYTNLLNNGGQVQNIEGKTHEQGGEFIGMGANGKPNIAEDGEVKIGNFIFSNRF